MATRVANPTPQGSLADDLDRHLKTFATREPRWDVWGVETQVDPKYARSQRRYLGTSGNVSHTDPNALMGRTFTLTILEMPPGHRQPLHHHADEEEVFFVLEGSPTVVWEYGGEIVERQVGKWDMVYNPVGRVHSIRNDTDQPCFFQVMLGSPKPDRPRYLDPALRQVQALDVPDPHLKAKK